MGVLDDMFALAQEKANQRGAAVLEFMIVLLFAVHFLAIFVFKR